MLSAVEETAKPGMWVLKPLQLSRLDDSFEIGHDGVTIGRSDANTVVIPEAGFPYVSSHHARVDLEDGAPRVEDLGSKNGTFINGEPVTTSRLANGDILQLGNMGPRFAIVCTDSGAETLLAAATPGASANPPSSLSHSSLSRIKRGLGIPVDTDVDALIRRRNRRVTRRIWSGVLGLAIAAGIIVWIFAQQISAEEGRLRTLNEELTAKLEAEQQRSEEHRRSWENERSRLQRESTLLGARLQQLEKGAGASVSDIGQLRTQLAATHKKLEAYRPLDIERTGLERVRRVTESVVFLETKTYFRHEAGGLLHTGETEDGRSHFNFSDEGEPFVLESSGSGFVITDQGWILTNAHVIRPRSQDSWPVGADSVIKTETELAAVFSGTSRRHPATLIRSVYEKGLDMALLKIEPFEDMPYIESIDLELPVPTPMSEVYLSGFPLGRMAVHEGEVLIASTFKGILSRVVHPYLQIDAAVHPGNSGGPVIDTQGHVLGIATRVQKTPDGPYTPTIGYITPVGALSRVWPPPAGQPASSPANTRR